MIIIRYCGALVLQFLITGSLADGHCGEELFWRSTECYYNKTRDNNMNSFEKEYLKNDSIFFIESSCHGGLDYRQACSIESAARAHPHRDVIVLFVRAVNYTCLHSWPIKHLLDSYTNIHLYKIDIHSYLQDTPLANFFEDGKFNKSKYPTAHLSDILRFVTLYKFGGIYLDLDVIVSKSIDSLPNKTNFIVQENRVYIGAGVIGLTKDGIGRVISSKALSHQKRNYAPFEWATNSVGMITSIIKEMCNTTVPVGCKGMHVYQPETFYPVPYKARDEYYQVKEIPKHPYGFHLWNSATKYNASYRTFGENTLLGRLMTTFCPKSSEKLVPELRSSRTNRELVASRWLIHWLLVIVFLIIIYLVTCCTRKFFPNSISLFWWKKRGFTRM